MLRLILICFVIFCAPLAKADVFTLASTSFNHNQRLPIQYTCNGKDISPALSWSNAPTETKTFVIILSDPDAPGGEFYHWVVYNIPSIISSLDEGQTEMPPGAIVAENSFDKQKYSGPCPPKGSSHRYKFELYALDTNLILSVNADETKVLNAMQGHILDKASLVTHYQ
jgi:Raf kinase inhibitor-like YbhB/YbcL family protein